MQYELILLTRDTTARRRNAAAATLLTATADGPQHPEGQQQAPFPPDIMQHRVRILICAHTLAADAGSGLPGADAALVSSCPRRLWTPVEGMRPFLLLCPDRKQFVVLLAREPDTKVLVAVCCTPDKQPGSLQQHNCCCCPVCAGARQQRWQPVGECCAGMLPGLRSQVAAAQEPLH